MWQVGLEEVTALDLKMEVGAMSQGLITSIL